MGIQPAIVIVNGLSTGLSLRDEAQKRGYAVIGYQSQPLSFYHTIPKPYRPKYLSDPNFYDHTIIADNYDTGFRELFELDYKIEGIFAGSEMGVTQSCILAKKMNLVHNDYELIAARRDKIAMKEAVHNAGLRVTNFISATSVEDIEKFMESNSFPIVMKPPTGCGMFAFNICNSMEEVRAAFNTIYKNGNSLGDICPNVDVEEYIDGKEYAVNIFGNGEKLIVTDIWRYDRRTIPSATNLYYNDVMEDITDPKLSELKKYALGICGALGIKYGPAHAEIMIDKKGPVMIEVAARFPGARYSFLCRDHTNFDPIASAFDVFCGKRVEIPSEIKWKKFCLMASCANEKEGTICSIDGLEEIKELPSYEHHFLSCRTGDQIKPTTDLWNIPCFIWFVHENKNVIVEDAKRAHELFQIKV